MGSDKATNDKKLGLVLNVALGVVVGHLVVAVFIAIMRSFRRRRGVQEGGGPVETGPAGQGIPMGKAPVGFGGSFLHQDRALRQCDETRRSQARY